MVNSMTVTSALWNTTTDIMKSPQKIAAYASLGFNALAIIQVATKRNLSKKYALPLIAFNVLCPILMITQASLSESIDQAKANTTQAAYQIETLKKIIEKLQRLNQEFQERLKNQEVLLKERAEQIEQLGKTVDYLKTIHPTLKEAAPALAGISTTIQASVEMRRNQLTEKRTQLIREADILTKMRGTV